MRGTLLSSLMLLQVFQLSGCSSSTAQAGTSAPEPATQDAEVVEDAAPLQGDDSLERALAAANAFGEELGPVAVANADVRNFEVCERIGELVTRATALRDVGVPAEVPTPAAYREEIARLPADATMMASSCERDVDTVPGSLSISIELTFYRVLLQLESARSNASQEPTDETGSIAAARAVRDVLDPIVETHMDDRATALCARIDDLVASVDRLRAASVPPRLASSRHYGEEVPRLAAATHMAATYCGRSVETLSGDLVISIEVTFDRIWLMQHGQWPGDSSGTP
jgi:hypothetical protein